MFDTQKVQFMTTIFKKIPEEYTDIYVIPEIFNVYVVALFRRLKLPIRAIMHDTTPQKEIFGVPVVKTAEASANFNENTAIIIITKKPGSFIQATIDFKVNGGIWTIPTFAVAYEEITPIYDRLILEKVKQIYVEDGIASSIPKILSDRFARGLTTFLDSRYQNFKYQIWDSRNWFKPTYDFDDTAIVIQGPLVYENNYTVETFKLYRSIYPNVPIIVSTWKGEATDTFRRDCRENAIVLLENELPKNPAPFNVNLQLESSFQGVKYVKENTSAKFVLKTRTDQRINYFEFLVYFKNLLETFPPKGNKLKARIIFLDSTMSKSWPFFFTDYLSFGHIEDIFKLYGISRHNDPGEMTYTAKNKRRLQYLKGIVLNFGRNPIDYNLVTAPSHKLSKFNNMMSRICNAEVYIARTFYKEFIAPIDNSKLLETSWKFTVDYLILIDNAELIPDWFKYERNRYNIWISGFARWLDMYRNFKIDWV